MLIDKPKSLKNHRGCKIRAKVEKNIRAVKELCSTFWPDIYIAWYRRPTRYSDN